MRLTIVQAALVWEDKAANLQHFDHLLAPLVRQTDLVVLPEMFSTGFSMDAQRLAEPMDGSPTVAWIREKSAQLDAAIMGTFICRDADGAHRNRLVWAQPDGSVATYDKRHLFCLAGEQNHYAAGDKRLIVNWKGFAICPMICYDLRFPVWSRNRADAPYDLLIFTANWPSRRAHHWRALLQARAIENQAYCAGVNIVGTDGTGLEYLGDSAIIDFGGQHICHLAGQEGVFTTELSLENVKKWREQFPFLNDADSFSILP